MRVIQFTLIGEILVKGLNVGVGLGCYMMPDKTKEDFDSDGFFHTGDIGQFMSDGSIRIVDRKKNLVKLCSDFLPITSEKNM